jgi:hypothetical protein
LTKAESAIASIREIGRGQDGSDRAVHSEVLSMQPRVVAVLSQVIEVSVFLFAAAVMAVGAITLR